MKPQPFSVFQRPARQHAGRTLSPRPCYQRGDQPGAGDQPATPRPTSTRQPLPIADNRAPETTSRPLFIRKKTPKTSVLRSSRTSRSRTPKRTSPTRRTPKKDSRSPQKTSLSMDSRRTTRKIPVLKSRSRTPRADSRTPTPRTSRSRTPRASRLPTPRTSRSPTPRASRSPTPRATASASSSKVQPQQKIKKGLVHHSKDAVQDLLLQKPQVLRRGLGILRSRCLSHSRQLEALCLSARFRISGGILLEHDTAWDRGTESTLETMRRYYYLRSEDISVRDPPLPTKAERILFWSHATDVGALWSMLKDRDMLPMNAHGVEKFGCNIFYALGHEVTGSEIDE